VFSKILIEINKTSIGARCRIFLGASPGVSAHLSKYTQWHNLFSSKELNRGIGQTTLKRKSKTLDVNTTGTSLPKKKGKNAKLSRSMDQRKNG
jgi:hypothetical protein